MDISGENLYITPDELDAGTLAARDVAWNAACTFRNHVRHNGEWHFRLPIEHLDGFKTSLQAAADLPDPASAQDFVSRPRFERGKKMATELLTQLS